MEALPADLEMTLPDDFVAAQTQAVAACQAALAAGYKRLQVEILMPDLKPDVLAAPFRDLFAPEAVAFVFADAGAAALAKQRWAEWSGIICGVNQASRLPDTLAIIFVTPGIVEVDAVEALCNARSPVLTPTAVPVLLINPQLQDAATVGIGLAGRRLRQRFSSTFETCYHLRALADGTIVRQYPEAWQVWDLNNALLQTYAQRPTADDLDALWQPSTLGGWRRFLRALGR